VKKQALLTAAALLMIGAAGCATAPVEQSPVVSSNEVPPTVEATTSDMSTSASADPVGAAAPADVAPVAEAAPTSLGASSSGRGH